jgi:signal transduction histidine kinase
MTTPPERDQDPSHAYLRTTFLERIAHELRGPAGVTKGALDEIERALGAKADDVRPFLAMARRGVGRILRSADRLQRTAHFEARREAGVKAPTDLRKLAAAATREAEGIEARRSVRVELTECEEPCLVVADAPWLHAAIGEIVGNAIRFAKSLVVVDTRLSGGEATVTVLDDGPGFEGPPPPRFEPPFPRRGLGLSLPLVSDIVAGHAGRLSIHDRSTAGDGAGTRVVVALKVHGTTVA